jgi:hypothetical protein
MQVLQKLLNKLNGLHYPQEYLCFSKENFDHPLHIYLVNDNRVIKDIKNQQLFVGYKPVIFVFHNIEMPASIQLIFSSRVLQLNGLFSKKDALALLELKLIKKQVAGDSELLYYEGKHGMHHFLPGFHQFMLSLNNELYNKRPENVFLDKNLYKQVQIAYAVPRSISLITVADDGLFNLFPSDLNGQAGEEYYVISLRIGGKACEQVEKAGKLLISQIHCDAYKTVYGLGKNHMRELGPSENFPFSGSLSANFKLPLPRHALSYRELILRDSFTYGIHKLFLFKSLARQEIQPPTCSLAHIHNAYATWRYKNGLKGNYLLR